MPDITDYAAQADLLRKRAEHLRRCGWAWAGTPTAERIEGFARELEAMSHKLDQQLVDALLQRAERARRLARETTDTLMVNRLNKYAETLEAQVAHLADSG